MRAPRAAQPLSAAAGQIDTEASIAVGSTAQQFLGHFDICQLFSTECSTAAGYLLYDQLFSIGSDGKWYSDILKSYEWSTEAENQLVLTLKDNIYFSNGDQMTMEDVLYPCSALPSLPAAPPTSPWWTSTTPRSPTTA